MAEKADDDFGLTEAERDLKFRIASGEFAEWIEAGTHLHASPPWYEPGLQIARLRKRERGGDLATHAKDLFNEAFGSLEARLNEARMQDRLRDDPVGYQFTKIRMMISPSTSEPERTFITYVLNAPNAPTDSANKVAQPTRGTSPAWGDGRAPRETEADNRPERDPIAVERNELLQAYQSEGAQRGVRITDKMIAEAASSTWHDRTPVQRWKRNDPRCKEGHDVKIRAVLKNKPHLR